MIDFAKAFARLNNNKKNSNMALYPVNVYELAALYIINNNIHMTIQKAQVLNIKKVNINMTIKKSQVL